MTRSRWGAVLLLVAVFVAGGLVGAGVWRAAAGGRSSSHHHRERGPEGYVGYLTRRLNLSPAQQDSVRAVLRHHEPAMDTLWQTTAARFDSLRANVRSDIRAQLSPEQQQTYAKMLQDADARRRNAASRSQEGRDGSR